MEMLASHNEYGEQMSQWLKLPEELILKIFEYINPVLLSCSVLLVCRRWNRLGSELMRRPDVWYRLNFSECNLSNESVSEILIRKGINVRRLNLADHLDGLAFLKPAIFHCNNLTCLELQRCDYINEIINLKLVEHCPVIESLNLKYSASVGFTVLQAIAQWKKLKRLNLAFILSIDEEGFQFFNGPLQLEELNIDGLDNVSDNKILFLIDAQGPSLRKLHLPGINMTETTYMSLTSCSRLTELKISRAAFLTVEGLNAINQLNGLSRLEITEATLLSATDFELFFENPNLKSLTDITFADCPSFDDVAIKSMIKRCPELKSLSLAMCKKISDKGIKTIVSKCKHLEKLNLEGLKEITDQFLTSRILNVTQNLNNLIYLNLKGCLKMPQNIIPKIKGQKNNLVIVCDASWR